VNKQEFSASSWRSNQNFVTLTFLISLCKSFSLLISHFIVLNDRSLVSEELQGMWMEGSSGDVYKERPQDLPAKSELK